jgi:DNA polymerase III subunit epsilon
MGMNEIIQFLRQMSGKLGSNIYAGVQGQTSPQHIAFLRKLQIEIKQKNSLELPLENLRVTVFDLETTGFNPEKGDRVISIGGVQMIGEQLQKDQVFYSLVKWSRPLSAEISLLTNIYNEDLIYAPDASEVLINFFKFVGSSILVAHHAKHEQAFMQKMTLVSTGTKFEHRILDTSFFIGIVNPQLKSLPLEDICLLYDIEITHRHHALEDANVTAQIWSLIIKKAKDLGLKNLKEVYEYLSKLR